MSAFTSLAAELIFGPPAPLPKDSTSTSTSRATGSKAVPMRLAKRKKKDASAVSMQQPAERTLVKPCEALPPPESATRTAREPSAASSSLAETVISSGSSVLSVLGDWISAPTPVHAPTPSDSTPTPSTITLRPAASTSILESVTSALVDSTASVCEAAVSTVKQGASYCANTVVLAITDKSSIDAPPRCASPTASISSFSSTVSYIPPQYTATGELFSSDPSVAAMQRIPDYSCGHDVNGKGVLHCCSLPPSRTPSIASSSSVSLPGCASPEKLSRSASFASVDCTCDCFKALPLPPGAQSPTPQKPGASSCECQCHDHARYRKGQSGHFHRVEQIVRGTKRVVRDIKNVL